MKINFNRNNPSFEALRVPLKYGTQKNIKKKKKLADTVFYKYNANGILDPDYRTMFFMNKKLEDDAEMVLKFYKINYIRSDLADVVSVNERNFWAVNGRFPSVGELKVYTSKLIRNKNNR